MVCTAPPTVMRTSAAMRVRRMRRRGHDLSVKRLPPPSPPTAIAALMLQPRAGAHLAPLFARSRPRMLCLEQLSLCSGLRERCAEVLRHHGGRDGDAVAQRLAHLVRSVDALHTSRAPWPRRGRARALPLWLVGFSLSKERSGSIILDVFRAQRW